MKKFLLSLAFLCGMTTLLSAQSDLWLPMPALGDISDVQDTPQGVYILSEGGLFLLQTDSLQRVTPIGKWNGLSDTDIVQIGFDSASSALILYYNSGNIDIIDAEGRVKNISAVYENLSLSDKALAQMLFATGRVFIATHFGILEINPEKASIVATYLLMTPLKSIAVAHNSLYALTKDGKLLCASLTDNLQDPDSWHQQTLPNDPIAQNLNAIYSIGDKLILLGKDAVLAEVDLAQNALRPFEWHVNKAVQTPKGLFLLKQNEVVLYSDEGESRRFSIGESTIGNVSMNNQKDILYGVHDVAVCQMKLQSDPIKVVSVVPEWQGPSDNHFFFATLKNGYYYAVGGGRGINRYWTPGSIKIREPNGSWHSITYRDLPEEIRNNFYDLVSVAPDPADPLHIFAGSWGEGLYEFRNYKFEALYHSGNSPLQSALADSNEPNRYVRVGSLAFDKKGNLWMMQGGVQRNIVCFDAAKKWHLFEQRNVAGVNSFAPTAVLPGGSKWMPIYRRGGGIDASQGILVYNEQETLDDPSDDYTDYISQFTDRNGKVIEATRYFCITLDQNNALWIGSNKGPLVVSGYQTGKNKAVPVATRPVGGKEPNLFYMLDNLPVVDIAVDQNNCKWVATDGDGLYFLNEDASEIYQHFTAANSPLPSNSVNTIELDNESGLLYIGTDAGLIAYQTGSHPFAKEQRAQIHAYPNPLRPEDPDLITITGLTAGMEIKFTDASGSLVWNAVSSGASYQFNARGSDGERLPAGVYLVALYDPATKLAHYLKIAVIN